MLTEIEKLSPEKAIALLSEAGKFLLPLAPDEQRPDSSSAARLLAESASQLGFRKSKMELIRSQQFELLDEKDQASLLNYLNGEMLAITPRGSDLETIRMRLQTSGFPIAPAVTISHKLHSIVHLSTIYKFGAALLIFGSLVWASVAQQKMEKARQDIRSWKDQIAAANKTVKTQQETITQLTNENKVLQIELDRQKKNHSPSNPKRDDSPSDRQLGMLGKFKCGQVTATFYPGQMHISYQGGGGFFLEAKGKVKDPKNYELTDTYEDKPLEGRLSGSVVYSTELISVDSVTVSTANGKAHCTSSNF